MFSKQLYKTHLRQAACLAAGLSLAACQSQTSEHSQNEESAQDSINQQPNILCITCEDISPMLRCFGDSVAYTPNLDQLAAEGVMYTNVFSTAGVCAPSRAGLITGMYPSSFGANNMRTNRKTLPNGIPPYEAVPPAAVKCVSELMRAGGYYCTNNEKEDYQFNAPVTAWDESSRKAHWRNRPEGMPFFSIFNLMVSHESQIWVRMNDPLTITPDQVSVPPYYPDDSLVRRDIAQVYNNIAIMDREVGEILDMLKEDGLYDNTIIIFYSDHGGPLPRQKREIYDSGLKVPMIIRFPNKQHAGTTDDQLVSFIDIPASILSLANIKIPDYMHGQAFLGQQKSEPREYIFAARDRMDGQYDTRRAVRDKRFKYIRNYKPEIPCYLDIKFRKSLQTMNILLAYKEAGKLNEDQMYWFRETKAKEELYNIEKDPHELHNLANDPAYQADLERLRKVHEQWMTDIGDKGLMTEKELVWSMWPDGIQPETAPAEVSQKEKISVSCATEGASIGYIINKNEQKDQRWLLYTEPIAAPQSGDTLFITTHRIGYKPAEIQYIVK